MKKLLCVLFVLGICCVFSAIVMGQNPFDMLNKIKQKVQPGEQKEKMQSENIQQPIGKNQNVEINQQQIGNERQDAAYTKQNIEHPIQNDYNKVSGRIAALRSDRITIVDKESVIHEYGLLLSKEVKLYVGMDVIIGLSVGADGKEYARTIEIDTSVNEGDASISKYLNEQDKKNRLDNINEEIKVLSEKGMYSEMINAINESLQIMKELYGENSSEYGKRLSGLGMAYARAKRYDEAEKFLEESLKIGQEHPGEYDQTIYAGIYRFLAFSNYKINKYQDARKYAYMALAIYKDSGREDTPESIEMRQLLDRDVYNDTSVEVAEKDKEITKKKIDQPSVSVSSGAVDKTETPSVPQYVKSAKNFRNADKKVIKKIALTIIGIFLLIIVIISLYNTYTGNTVFFSSYFDLIGSLIIPVIIYFVVIYILNVLGIKSKNISLEVFYCCAGGATIYHYIKALIENRENKLLALCIGTSRFVLGYVIIIISLAVAFLGGSSKRADKSDTVYALRQAGENAVRLATIGGLMWFIGSLVGRRTYHKELYSKEEVQAILEEYRQRMEAKKQNNYVAEMEEMDPYMVLGVENRASKDEVKKAWRDLCFQYHPDKTKGLGQDIQNFANMRMQEINKAYEVLSKDFDSAGSYVSQDDNKKRRKEDGNIKNIKCPFCAEEIQVNDTKCKHCGELLSEGGVV